MATSAKEKNMPTISSNLYGGLQKWVNRASLSIRDRKRSRRNSDVSQTMYRPNPAEMNGYQDHNPSKIVPVHGRSRSTPVMMPDPENYLNTLEQGHRKTSEESKTVNSQQEALLEPWGRRESKDDPNRPQRERKTDAVGRGTLRRSCSKSESSLIEAAQNSEALRSTSKTSPPKSRVSRTSSQGTEESLESYPSDVDINYNINKDSRSSQASSKANKRERAQTLATKLDSNGSNRPNDRLIKSNSHDKIARDVKARLDKWVDRTNGFQDSRQTSFESTSSSDDWSDILVMKRENNQAKEMRELRNALDELVSSCGRSSRKSSDEESQARDSIEATNTRAARKISLKNTGLVFSKAVDIDYHCPQSVRQNEYRIKKCGSSSGSAGSGGSNMEGYLSQQHQDETNSELEESYDSVDGKSAEIERGVCDSGMIEKYETKDSVSCDNDIVQESQETRVSMTPENLESEIDNQNNISALESTSQNECEVDCQHEDQQSKYYDQQGDNSLPNETKQAGINEQFPKQNQPVGGVKDELQNASKMKLPKSTKTYRAPQPPTAKDSERKSKKSDAMFNDVSLDAFAEECLRQADQKKMNKTKERESKSDSEEEKRGLKIDFVYIKKDENEGNLAQSYPGQVVHRRKAGTHPKTAFDEDHLAYIAFSDNELDRNDHEFPSVSRRIREKRNSADSLDGRALFELSPTYDVKNEDDHSSDGLQTEEELATENTGAGMRKFPSMPLFYVPKEFDQNGEFKRNKSVSIRKSLWNRIKSLPRQSEHQQRVNNHTKSKKKEEDTSSAQFVDPFYHGEKEEQKDVLGPTFRAKAWTLSGTRTSHPGSQVRPSLEGRRSAPVMKVNAIEHQPVRSRLLNDYVVIPPKDGDESQC